MAICFGILFEPTNFTSMEYVTACEAWAADEEIVLLKIKEGKNIGQIPIAFLRASESTNCIYYLQYIVRELLCLPLAEDVPLFFGDERMDDNAKVISGIYTYHSSKSPILQSGPQYKSRPRAHSDSESFDAISEASDSSDRPNMFQMKVMIRDGHCLVTGSEDIDNMSAAHIVPISLGQDLLNTLTVNSSPIGLNSMKNGITLRTDIHKAFNCLKLGFYIDQAGRHYLHTFGTEYHDLHGMEIHFRCRTLAYRPHVPLLRWQYQQCLLARVRGYSFFKYF